jgi:repressor LexA
VREIGTGVGLASPSTVHRHLEKLEEGGHLRRDPSKPRAMLVGLNGGRKQAAPPPRESTLPLVGAVAAGAPILAEEHVEDHVAAPFAADYLLRVKGDSMINAGILDGDLVAVKQQDSARDGQIVVARLGDEVTVKRYQKTGSVITLLPENTEFEPIIVKPDADQFALEGLAVGLLRSWH